jgi:hypothetical protein
MATANGSGTPTPPEDDDPIERSPEMQALVDRWFPEEPSTTEQGGGGR